MFAIADVSCHFSVVRPSPTCRIPDRPVAVTAAGSAPPSVELSTNGVGPWRGELPTDERFDPELLQRGIAQVVVG
mgnify:CR=1 FL=1